MYGAPFVYLSEYIWSITVLRVGDLNELSEEKQQIRICLHIM